MSFEVLSGSGIYLDHNATTPPAVGLKSVVTEVLEYWGNPSSIHWAGHKPKILMREAREKLAKLLEVHPMELVFTSGGTEANNQALRGLYLQAQEDSPERRRVVVSAVEHPSVLKTAEVLHSMGADLQIVPVSREGKLDLSVFEELLKTPVALVSVMYANNETGHIFPIKKMAKMARAAGAMFHTDCVQTLGKLPLNLGQLDVDMATFSGHKFYGLKGAGLLYCRRGVRWKTQITGGAQERGRRAGTENLLSIVSMGHMVEALSSVESYAKSMGELRDYLESEVQKRISGIEITGSASKRLPNTSHMIIKGVDGEILLMNLDMEGFAVSTGAACSSGSPEPSPTLLAMGFQRDEAQSSLRLSLGWENTKEEVDQFLDVLEAVVLRVRRLES
jgi:cysteine desulfurase